MPTAQAWTSDWERKGGTDTVSCSSSKYGVDFALDTDKTDKHLAIPTISIMHILNTVCILSRVALRQPVMSNARFYFVPIRLYITGRTAIRVYVDELGTRNSGSNTFVSTLFTAITKLYLKELCKATQVSATMSSVSRHDPSRYGISLCGSAATVPAVFGSLRIINPPF